MMRVMGNYKRFELMPLHVALSREFIFGTEPEWAPPVIIIGALEAKL